MHPEALKNCNLYDHLVECVFHGTCLVNARITLFTKDSWGLATPDRPL